MNRQSTTSDPAHAGQSFDNAASAMEQGATALEAHHRFLQAERERYVHEPQCALLRSFLVAHHVTDILGLSPEKRKELFGRLNAVFARLRAESREMLAVYGVEDGRDLAPNQRDVYDTRMRALVKDMDHYP